MTIMPGYALIEMDQYFPTTGLIIAPEPSQDRRSLTGTIRVITPRPRDIACLGQIPSPGDRVLLAANYGVETTGGVFIYPITARERRDGRRGKRRDVPVILAILEGEGSAAPIEQAIERCRHCGPAVADSSKQGMILQPGENGELVCPRCGKNRYGRVPEDRVDVSDAEVEEFQDGLRRRARESRAQVR